ncbi:class C sortase [Timonella senegalensis]|uniref:class C sortase n=2 Tax=Timonella senegalensis TaxID=1465825 RepID=UPI002FDE15E0
MAPHAAPTRSARLYRHARKKPTWRPSMLSWSIYVIGILALVVGFYPQVSAWFSSYNQSLIVENYNAQLAHARPSAEEQLRQAREYNDALSAGVVLESNARVASGVGTSSNADLKYNNILRVNSQGLMARLKVPSVDIDIPVYHGTSDAVLLKGSGHLEGSHLPVGGPSTRSVLTAHRGLASSTMFTNLDKVKESDTFSIEVFGEVLVYRVRDIKVIAPEDTDTLKVEANKDLVTLITCTPLGVNSHRILVTGERVESVPGEVLKDATAAPTIPGFPWWAVWIGLGLLVLTGYLARQGRVDSRQRMRLGKRADESSVLID